MSCNKTYVCEGDPKLYRGLTARMNHLRVRQNGLIIIRTEAAQTPRACRANNMCAYVVCSTRCAVKLQAGLHHLVHVQCAYRVC